MGGLEEVNFTKIPNLKEFFFFWGGGGAGAVSWSK